MAPAATNTSWDVEYNTLRREHLFRNPPTDHTAYPALQIVVDPHIESFNAVFKDGGLLDHGILDIGTKVYLDGDRGDPPTQRNALSVRIKRVDLQRPRVPRTNLFARNPDILPAECR